jgi:hypothetical protein
LDTAVIWVGVPITQFTSAQLLAGTCFDLRFFFPKSRRQVAGHGVGNLLVTGPAGTREDLNCNGQNTIAIPKHYFALKGNLFLPSG